MTKLHLKLIHLIGVIVPRRLRADWRQEWLAELHNREELLKEWDHLNLRMKLDLLRRSLGAFRDALLLQPRRLEDEMFQDLLFGSKMLLKKPIFTLMAILTLALGIGLTTAIFSLSYSVLLRAFPYPEPQRLVALWNTSSHPAAAGLSRLGACSADWIEWREQSKLFEDIALTRLVSNFNLTGDGPPERVQGGRTTWNLPQVLGVKPILGRSFTEEEANQDARVAVLSYGFWKRRFGLDPGIVGRKIQLNGESFEVIGVMPPEFRYPTNEFELWTPLFIPPREIESRMGFNYRAVGRLKPGVSLQQAQEEMSAIMHRLNEQYPAINVAGIRGVLVESLLDSTAGQFQTVIYVLVGAVGCLLLIACINLSGLLIVRASTRAPEFAIRSALGANAFRLRRQTLAEMLPLSIVGGIGGVLLAWWLLRVLVPLLPPQLPGIQSIGLHTPVLLFALALSLIVVLLAGMLPARMASRVQLTAAMQQGSRTVAGGNRMRNSLVIAQIAVTVLLVFAGGLLVRSLYTVMKVNPGFSAEGVLTMHLAVTRAKYPKDIQVSDYYDRLVARVKTIPGVTEAGIINLLPFSGNRLGSPVEFEGRLDEDAIGVDNCSITPGYFSAMGIPIIRGRDFTEADKAGASAVGIIDEQLALRVFGDVNPLGKRFRFGTGAPTTHWREIVAVVGHVRHDSLESDRRPQVYTPESQQTLDRGVLVVKATNQPEAFAAAVIDEIHKENPDQPVYDVSSMEDWLNRSLQSRNLLTGLVTLFVGSSLLLACLGLYGVVSYGVALRLREFAIRTALGAQPKDVRRLVLAHTARLWIVGSAIGLIASWPTGRALQSLLFGVGTTDAVSLALAPSLLLITGLMAGLGPALRASRVDPAVVLRGE